MSRLYLLLFLLSPFWSKAQNLTIGMQVVATGGGSGAQGNYDVSWTIGEPVIQTISNQSTVVTQGFHQPDLFRSVSTWDPALAALNINALPNPASAEFHLKLDGYEGQSLELYVFDAFGKRIVGPMSIIQADTQIDCQNWPSGLYFLNLRNPQRKSQAALKLIKF